MRTTNFSPDQSILIASGAVGGGAAGAEGSVVLSLVNRTGAAVAEGDVVVLDTGNDSSFVSTTTPQFGTGLVGVVLAPTYNGSNGRVLVRGYAPKVNVNGSNATRGHLLATSQVALAAGLLSARAGGTFGQVLASGVTPPADIWGVPDRVTTIIHSSNSLIGPVTFTTPGNSVSITMPSPGTLALQSTGGGAGGAAYTVTGKVLVAGPPIPATAFGAGTNATANIATAFPITVNGTMIVKGILIDITSSASGLIQWGLFDYATSPSAATKLAGGSTASGGTGWRSLPATGEPVTIAPGNYMVVIHQPSANVPTWRCMVTSSTTPIPFIQWYTTYTWTDTPDFTSASWVANSTMAAAYIEGYLDSGSNRWT